MANYIIAGGSGFIGKHIQSMLLAVGHDVYVLTRKKTNESVNKNLTYVQWNPAESYIDSNFQCKDAFIINLAGAGVAEKRWSQARKKLILESRTQSLETLWNACASKQIHCLHITSASAIGFYGNGLQHFKEDDKGDQSYLSQTCQAWERAIEKFAELNITFAIVRVGIVLGTEAGALKEFIKPMKWRIAGIPGSGKQIYSWIHIQDVARIFIYLTENKIQGIYNAAADKPCSIKEIFNTLKKHYPILIEAHAPDWILKIILGEMAIEVLKSTSVDNSKIKQIGFTFLHTNLETCLNDLLKKS